MTVKAHPNFNALLIALKRVAVAKLRPWAGTIYRSAPPEWSAGRDMVTGAGSIRSGARFNAPDSFAAVYGSTTPELAMTESLAFQRRAGLPIEQAMPRVFKAIQVNVERLLDLTAPDILAELGVTLDALKQDQWWLARARGEESLTQAMGRAADVYAIQAIIAASAHTSDPAVNVIVFLDHLSPPSFVRVVRRRPRR